MDSYRIRQLLKCYLEGNNSRSEEKRVDNWYQRLDEQDPVVLDGLKEERVREEIWQAIQPALESQSAIVKKMNFAWLKVAAVLLIIVNLALFIWRSDHTKQLPSLVGPAYTEVSTKAGEHKQINLPDGSVLILNSATSIQISNHFSSQRLIRIVDGEVYFDVKHDISRIFTIQSGPLTTRVLGTAFDIRAYHQLNKIAVGVTRGMVSVAIENKPVHLLPKGQQLVFEKLQTRVSIMPIDKQLLAWQQGRLVLNDASFEEMAFLLNKNYGIFVSCPDHSVTSKHFSANLPTSLSAIKALEVIAAIYQLELKQRRDTIEVYK
jgi:transmembrane sensor